MFGSKTSACRSKRIRVFCKNKQKKTNNSEDTDTKPNVSEAIDEKHENQTVSKDEEQNATPSNFELHEEKELTKLMDKICPGFSMEDCSYKLSKKKSRKAGTLRHVGYFRICLKRCLKPRSKNK